MGIVGRHRGRAAAGFTLMELLGAIAIMAILGVVAVPAFSAIARNLEMTRLDQTAKEVYLAAQTRMTGLQNDGLLMSDTATSDSIAKKVVATTQDAGVPADYSYDNSSDISVYYLLSSDELAREVFVTDQDSTITRSLPGSWVIELSPTTGEVYSVFYHEGDTQLTWADVQGLPGLDRDSRTSSRIGYYHGGRLQKAGTIGGDDPFDKLEFSLVNSEELYVSLKSDGFSSVYDDVVSAAASGTSFSLTLELSGAGTNWGQATWKHTWSGRELVDGGSWVAGADELDIVLDSMRDGMHFAELFQGDGEGTQGAPSIVPGTDVTAKVTISYDGAKHENQATSNSMYASLVTTDGTTTASIANVRHLNNLRSTAGTVTLPTLGSVNTFSRVVQTDDIDFIREDGSDWANPASVSVQSRDADGNAVNPLPFFTPLDERDFYGWSGFSLTGKDDAGTSHVIRNFVIGDASAPTSETGLFKSIGFPVSDVSLVNTSVHGLDYTGALAGSVKNNGASITDCSVTVDKTDADGTYLYSDYVVGGRDVVGGLVGHAPTVSLVRCTAGTCVTGRQDVGGLLGYSDGTTMTDCAAYGVSTAAPVDDAVPYVTGTSSVGGLLGYGYGTISRCFAAVNVLPTNDEPSGTSAFGGLIGTLSRGWGSLRNCYASGSVRSGATAGGLIGWCGGDVVSCYSTGDVFCDSTGGGFIGVFGSGANGCWNSVSYGRVLAADGSLNADNGPFFGSVSSYWASTSTSRYLSAKGYNDGLTTPSQAYSPVATSYADLTSQGSLAADDSHPYSASLKADAFPYADTCGLGAHHGNWPQMHTVSWARDNGHVFASAEVLDGVTPSFAGSLSDADYLDANGLFHIFQSWDAGTTDAHGNVTYTARCTTTPVVDLLADTTLGTNVDVDGTSCKTLWSYFDSRTSGNSGKASKDYTCDSEAIPNDALANAATWLNASLASRGYDVGGFSYSIYVRSNTYANSADYISGAKRLGTQPNGTDTGCFITLLGGKLPAYGQSTPESSYRVLVYDVGHRAWRTGTVGVGSRTFGSTSYYVYDPKTFSATSDWFDMGQMGGDR